LEQLVSSSLKPSINLEQTVGQKLSGSRYTTLFLFSFFTITNVDFLISKLLLIERIIIILDNSINDFCLLIVDRSSTSWWQHIELLWQKPPHQSSRYCHCRGYPCWWCWILQNHQWLGIMLTYLVTILM